MPKIPLPAEILKRCCALRKNDTDAEKRLWSFLRNRQLNMKFRRQYPFQGYILDFYCHAAQLAIEVDGGGHLEEGQALYDQERTLVLNSHGIKVLRFFNEEILKELEKVILAIWEELTPSF